MRQACARGLWVPFLSYQTEALAFVFTDACGLIRWLLMVNPTRRATLEDVASHWWVNWGYTTRVGEQEALRESGHLGGDSGRASMADWLRRSSRPLLENGAKVCSFFKQHVPGGGSTVPGLERQHSLKKSRKENDMAQTLQGDPAEDTAPRPGKSSLKLPKSILKKKASTSSGVVQEDPQELSPVPDTPGQPVPAVALLPRKGILKKSRQRESGYYSSPEPSESGELLDAAGDVFVNGDPVEQKSSQAAGHLLHRKGILKLNGKFSSTALESTTPSTFGSLDQLASPHPVTRASRPSGAVSEDSILSSESFDQLDLPDRLPETPLRGCVSVDNLRGLEQPPSEGLRRWWQEPLGDSCFSLTDCQEVTAAYRQALGICSKLS